MATRGIGQFTESVKLHDRFGGDGYVDLKSVSVMVGDKIVRFTLNNGKICRIQRLEDVGYPEDMCSNRFNTLFQASEYIKKALHSAISR